MYQGKAIDICNVCEISSILIISTMIEFKYEVEMLNKDGVWEKDIRTYYREQKVEDFTDNKMRRNFKKYKQ